LREPEVREDIELTSGRDAATEIILLRKFEGLLVVSALRARHSI
jgi:hypothetical protein